MPERGRSGDERSDARGETLAGLLGAGRPADGRAVFLRTPDGKTVSYDDLWRESARVAAGLAALGVVAGDRVAAKVRKSPGAVLLYVACLRSGAVLVPVNPEATDHELDYLVRDAEPAVVVDDGALASLAEGPLSSWRDAPVAPEDPAAMLYTSGTTGRPKGAMLSHRNLASNAAVLRAAWGFGAGDVLLHALPVFHAHGLFVAVNTVLASGASMVFLPRFEVDTVIRALSGATVLMGVPTFYTRLLASPRLDRASCASIRLFVSGSAPLSAATHREFQERTGHSILERYGMTETLMLASNPLVGERRAGSVGSALPGVEIRILDTERREQLPAGGTGEIEVRGPGVFSGYWRRPEATAAAFSPDGFFRTGDLGRLEADGYLTIVGRSTDLVISGGLNVYPREVEGVLDALEGVAESAVVGVGDPDFGEAVIAFVVPKAGFVLEAEALRAAARERLAPYKVPRRVTVVDALPRNAMGKIAKADLRRRLT